MNTSHSPRTIKPLVKSAATAIAVLLALATTTQTQAFTDDFNSGSLNGWATSSSSNFPSTFSFVPDGYGGSALRMVCTTSALQTNGGLQNTPRAIAWYTNQYHTNSFYMAVDLVNWNPSTDTATNDAVFCLGERLVPSCKFLFPPAGYPDPNIPVGQPDTVIFSTRINANGGTNSGTRGNFNMYWIVAGQVGSAVAQGDATVVPGHSYRLVFTGTNDPGGRQYLFGYVYDLLDLTRPLVSLIAADGNNPGYFPSGAYSGTDGGYPALMALGYRDPDADVPPNPLDDYYATNRGADVTFDNFVALPMPPTSVPFPGTPHGMAAIPQVVNRTPISMANFYPASGGISFNATTLTTTNSVNTNAIKLYLNGVDVSAGLGITGPATNAGVAYNGLRSNVVYEARIELTDALGRKTTNQWTFDTFSDAYLASAVCRNIECEDYDYGGGLFIDYPPPSGFDSNSTYVQRFVIGANTGDTPPPGGNVLWTNGVNTNSGYVNRLSIKGTDFFDYDNVGTLAPYLNRRAGENQFNQVNPAGTTQGFVDYQYGWYDPISGFGVQPFQFNYDTQRQKYFNVTNNLLEYVLERTEGGEWYNYTRSYFYGTNHYWAYLRHGSGLSQAVRLDHIAAGPATNTLGTFNCVNALFRSNFKYAPLRDGSGNLAVVNLPTGNNTLRLTMDSPQGDATKQGLALNYMAFVPALMVESSASVNSGYTIDNTAVVEPGTGNITIPQSTGTRFYRLRWDRQATIKSIRLSAGNVLLTYQ